MIDMHKPQINPCANCGHPTARADPSAELTHYELDPRMGEPIRYYTKKCRRVCDCDKPR